MVLIERDRENVRLGERRRSVASVRRFRTLLAPEDLSEICDNNSVMLEEILTAIDTHPDWDDEKIAENLDFD